MNDSTIDLLICPLCRAPLKKCGGSLKCTGERVHCYDISRKGYVNLLPPGKMSNARAGDDSGMIEARRRFLSSGMYDIFSECAADAAMHINENIVSFVDAGCGEGHHTLNIAKRIEEISGAQVTTVGFDASKSGAAAGASAAKAAGAENVFFAAANIFALPVRDASVDSVFSLFAPVPDSEAYRILKDDGNAVLTVCSSGSRHLWQMREVLYGTPREYEVLSRVPTGFEIAYKTKAQGEITVTGEDIRALFGMTPFYYRSPREGREKLLSLDSLTTEISAEFTVYKKIKQ